MSTGPGSTPGGGRRNLWSSIAVATRPHINLSPHGLANLQGPPVWVPSIVFVNTPNTDLTLTDTKASLNVRKLGQHTVSTLDNVEQVSTLAAYFSG